MNTHDTFEHVRPVRTKFHDSTYVLEYGRVHGDTHGDTQLY
jgi:hypothetical protein